MADIMERKREERRKEFLALTPLERLTRMDDLFNEILSIRAGAEGKSEYEIYKEYLGRGEKNP